jgi:hypothetical protein
MRWMRDELTEIIQQQAAEIERLRAKNDELMGIGTPYLDGLTEAELERYAQLSPPEMFRHMLNAQAENERLRAELAEKEAEAAYWNKHCADMTMEHHELELRIAELAEKGRWEPLPDGLYLDGALAISYGGRDIGLKIDDEEYAGDDWVGNYQWLSDCEIHDIRAKDEEYRLCRRVEEASDV